MQRPRVELDGKTRWVRTFVLIEADELQCNALDILRPFVLVIAVQTEEEVFAVRYVTDLSADFEAVVGKCEVGVGNRVS